MNLKWNICKYSMLMLKELRFKTDQEKSLQRLKKRQTKDINLTAFVSILIYILFYLHHFFFIILSFNSVWLFAYYTFVIFFKLAPCDNRLGRQNLSEKIKLNTSIYFLFFFLSKRVGRYKFMKERKPSSGNNK